MKEKIKRLQDFRKSMLVFAGSSILGMIYAFKISGDRSDSSAFKLTVGMAIIFTFAAMVSHFRINSLQKRYDEVIIQNKNNSNSRHKQIGKKSKNTKKRNSKKK